MPNTPTPPHARFPWPAAAGLMLMAGAALGAAFVYLDQPTAVVFAFGAAVGATAVILLTRRRRPKNVSPFAAAPKMPKQPALPKRAAVAPLEIDMTQFVQPGQLKRIEQQKKIAAVRDHPATSEQEREAAAQAMSRKRRNRKEA